MRRCLDSPEVEALIDALAPAGTRAQGTSAPRARRRLPCQDSVRAPDVDAGSRADRGASRLASRSRRRPERVGLLPLHGQAAREPAALADCLDRVAESLRDELPGTGGTSLSTPPTFPRSQTASDTSVKGGPERERFSDPDASWGHRSAVSTRSGGGFYGYKIHAAICADTDLPLAWRIETARRNESLFVAPLLDAARARGFQPETCAMDKGYDNNRVMDETRERGCVPSWRSARVARSRSFRSPTALPVEADLPWSRKR